MQFGLQIPHSGRDVDCSSIIAAARGAERIGFDSVWIDDHLLTPTRITSPYPYALDATYPATADDPYYDALALIGILTAHTTRITVGTDVFVAPYRHPIVLAKALATIERFSPGRVVCGLGAGWMREEFDALGVAFERRGARLVEYVAALRAVWSGQPSAFAGDFYAWPLSGFLPQPSQPIPVLLGGHAEPAVRRAARIADGFAAIAGPGESGSLAQFAARVEQVRGYVVEVGRDPDTFPIILCEVPVTFAAEPDPDRLLCGPPEVLAERLQTLRTLGVTTVVILPDGAGEQALEQAERFARDVQQHVT
jgi:probable F420-dependent oxidoreductase